MINQDKYRKLENFVQKLGKQIIGHNVNKISDIKKDIKLELDSYLNEKIISYLRNNFKFEILSEESEKDVDFTTINSLVWIVDPLDGSLNFSRNIPISCISISLWENKLPIYGLIYDMNRNELFKGYCKNNSDNNKEAYLNGRIIKVNNINNIDKGVLCTGFPSWRDYGTDSLNEFINKVKSWKKLRLLGSAAISLAWVASGRTDAYIEEDIRIWDVAAGMALVKSAGGSIFIQPNERKNFVTAIATNGNISIKELQ